MGGQIPMQLVLAAHETTRALTDGALDTGPLDITHTSFKPIHQAFKPMVREQKFDGCELAIVTAIQARAFGKPIVLLPVTVAARFQHKCLVCNIERGQLRPGDLPGKRIGVRAYTQTTGVWVRTILQREYGIASSGISWITTEDPHVAEYRDPANVIRMESDQQLAAMLRAGEIDAAIFGNDLPKEDWVRPVIADPDLAARQRFAQDQIVQINHVVALSKAFVDARPEAVGLLFDLFMAAKAAHPSQPGMPDLTPIGFEAMRPSVEVLLENALAQELLPSAMSFDELFAESIELLGTQSRS